MLHLFAPSSVLDAGERFTRDMLAASVVLFVAGLAYCLYLARPTTLEVDLVVEGAPEWAWVRAELQPTDWVGSSKSETCSLVEGRCRLDFSWGHRHAPPWPTRHVVEITAANGDRWVPLGALSLTAPNALPMTVRCDAGGTCRLQAEEPGAR